MNFPWTGLRGGGIGLGRRAGFYAEALSFHFDDPALGLDLVADVLGGLQVGDVDGVRAVVLQFAAADVLVEDRGRSPKDRNQATEDGLIVLSAGGMLLR